MRREIWIGKKGSRLWYYRYRDSEYSSLSIFIGTVLVCLLLLFYVIIPQVQNWFSIREEVIATQKRIQVLRNNIAYINNLDRGALDTQLSLTAVALPPEKEFGSMINVLSDAAITSGVSLNDFSFQVGNIASSAGQISDIRHPDLASIRITVVVVGSIQNVKRFVSQLENSLPISEIVSIDGSGQAYSVSVQFYQKAYPTMTLNADNPLDSLPAEKKAILEDLKKWKITRPIPNLDSVTATTGAIPLF